jgi:hypothetical protein
MDQRAQIETVAKEHSPVGKEIRSGGGERY